MKRRRFLGFVVAGLSLTHLASDAGESNQVRSLTDALGVKEFTFITIIHSPKGNQEGRVASYVTDRAKLNSLRQHLSEFPSKGGVSKRWPNNVDHWKIYIHGEDGQICSVELFNSLLQSPVDKTFVSNAKNPSSSELMKVLAAMQKAEEDG